MKHLVSDIVALIETVGAGPVHLVGHDWGAAVGWSLSLRIIRSWCSPSRRCRCRIHGRW